MKLWMRVFLALVLFVAPMTFVPAWWCSREAPALYRGDFAAYEPLAREVANWINKGLSDADFKTGHWQFNGEWHFGAYQMAGLGLCQLIRQYPEARATYLPVVEKCLDHLLAPEARVFDTNSWKEDAMATLAGDHGHMGYLGYLSLLLSVYRQLEPTSRFNERHDAIMTALIRRLEKSSFGLLETYPNEVYPVDNTSAIGAIALYDKVTGKDHSALLARLKDGLRTRFIDPISGLLFQAVDPNTGKPLDKPRASGTALGAYFLSFADRELSADLYRALKKSCGWEMAGFGAVYEYPPNVEPEWGDIDSGPLVFGLSMSGTGFALATARLHRDPDFFQRMYAMGYLAGFPVDRSTGRYFSLGGPLGTAIMLAMTTAGDRR